MNLRNTRNIVRIKNTLSALESKELTLPNEIYNLPGLTSPRSQTFLNKISQDKNVLEIGSFCGASTIAMASSAKHVSTFDNWENQETVAVLEKYENIIIDPKLEFYKNTKAYDNIDMYPFDIFKKEGYSRILELHKKNPFEVIFYDGSHKQEDVTKFLMLYEELFQDCILVLDDYNFPEVQQALTFCTKEYEVQPIKEFLIRTAGESKDHFWNGIAVQIFE